MPQLVIYIHGLNTYGHDHLQVGPIRLGLMHKNLQEILHGRSFPWLSVVGLRALDLRELVVQSAQFLQNWRQTKGGEFTGFHLLGHSTGGLIARALVHHLYDWPWKSLTTIACPHKGARWADLAIHFHHNHPWLYRISRLGGYDSQSRRKIFLQLSSMSMQEFNRDFPDLPEIHYASVVAAANRAKLSWPMKIMARGLDAKSLSDGIVEADSQVWGEVLGRYELDHLAQIGYNFYLTPKARARADEEFLDMCFNLNQFWSRFNR